MINVNQWTLWEECSSNFETGRPISAYLKTEENQDNSLKAEWDSNCSLFSHSYETGKYIRCRQNADFLYVTASGACSYH